jgi:putative transposase
MYGYKRVAVIARREGWDISNRQFYRILKKEGLLRRPVNRSAKLHQAQKLFELLPDGPNKLWQTDVTYVHIPGHGWWYAVTVIDYYSRYLLACHFTASYRAADCCEALELARGRAEMIHGSIPGRINLVTDNGSSFLARRFKKMLKEKGFDHYRIQYRTPQQLGLLERFHQNLKRAEIYWNLYKNPAEAKVSLEKYRHKYNTYRPHWSLKPKAGGDEVTPERVYNGEVEIVIPKCQGWAREAESKLAEQLTQMDQATG